jgi:zinc protease
LGGTSSSRLQKELVRGKQIVSGISVDYDLYARLPSLVTISATPAQGHSIEEVRQNIIAEIEDIKKNPINPAELERLKTQVIAGDIYARDSISTQAYMIGSLESIGMSWKEIDNYSKQIQNITAEQVQQAAKKYLVPERLTIATLNPLPLNNGDQAKSKKGDSNA